MDMLRIRLTLAAEVIKYFLKQEGICREIHTLSQRIRYETTSFAPSDRRQRYGYDKRTAAQKTHCGVPSACVFGYFATAVQCGGFDSYRSVFRDEHAVACGSFVKRRTYQSHHQRSYRLVYRHERRYEPSDRLS